MREWPECDNQQQDRHCRAWREWLISRIQPRYLVDSIDDWDTGHQRDYDEYLSENNITSDEYQSWTHPRHSGGRTL